MKKIISTLVFVVVTVLASAQINAVGPYPKTINVTGSASIEIVPDEIFVQIDLREYEKKGSGKIGIETIRNKFLEACKLAGIAESDLSVASYLGTDHLYALSKKKKNPDMMAGISYMIKFSNTAKIDALIEKLDDEATQGFSIVRTSHSKMEEFRKQLKIEAVKAAKEKAIYLSEAIGEQVGVAVNILEPVEYAPAPVYKNMLASNVLFQENQVLGVTDPTAAVDFKKIKLRFEVNAVFALQ
ncbi:MAG: SIMPL domain-containing protein [Chitinophagaceae bacterium]|nr:SIMPL domain-containing protein [Chitinophagaceae bacterium]MCW5925499.1 SIMPL domain-containing protein [Chitinophagaceae bacterium]